MTYIVHPVALYGSCLMRQVRQSVARATASTVEPVTAAEVSSGTISTAEVPIALYRKCAIRSPYMASVRPGCLIRQVNQQRVVAKEEQAALLEQARLGDYRQFIRLFVHVGSVGGARAVPLALYGRCARC